MFKLIIDERERQIHVHAKEYLYGFEWEKKTMTVGDYAITLQTVTADGSIQTQLIYAIERKTLADFVASFKDGRYYNKNKLRDIQLKTNCNVMFIVEGNKNIKPTSYIGGIQYINIESSLIHMELEYRWCTHYTSDELDTIAFLRRLLQSLQNMFESNKFPIDQFAILGKNMPAKAVEVTPHMKPISNIEKKEVSGSSNDVNNNCVNNNSSNNNINNNCVSNRDINTDAHGLLTTNYIKSDESIVREMWASFRGISVVYAHLFMKYSMKELINGLEKSVLATTKHENGRAISKRTITGLCNITEHDHLRVLTCIPKISKMTANYLLAEHSLIELLDFTSEELQAIPFNGGRFLSKNAADNILKYFNFKIL